MRIQPNGGAATLQGGVSAGEFRPSGAVSAQPVTCADGSRWSDLLGLLVDPDHPARLLAPTPHDNAPRPVGEGQADALLLEAERLGGLAVVAPIRGDLVAVDLDGCAAVVLPQLLYEAEQVGAVLVYLADSGSHDSQHVILGCPTAAGREWLRGSVERVRSWAGLDAREVDLRSGPGGGLRLPGSVALKVGGGPVVPVDLEGRRLGSLEAARRAREALESVGLPSCPAAAAEAASGPARRRGGPVAVSTDGGPVVRGWWARPSWASEDRALLHARPPVGQRSDWATAAARMIWRRGVRDWAEARRYYRRYPVFSKYRDRRDGGRAHWAGVADTAAAYRGPVTAEAASRCSGWLEAAGRWTAHDEAAAVAAVVWHRFADGRGLEGRPVAVRDLALWLGCGRDKAHRLLGALQGRGVLERVRSHADGPAGEAALYTLAPLPDKAPAEGVEYFGHELTPPSCGPLDPAVVLAPVWSVLGQGARAVWSLLSATTVSVAVLSAAAGLPGGRAGRSGVLLLLERLEARGLAVRCGAGWRRGRAGLEAAGRAAGAAVTLDRVRRRVLLERTRWHGVTERAERVAEHVLAGLRALSGGGSGAAGRAVGGSAVGRGAPVGAGAVSAVWGRSRALASRAGPGAGWP